MWRIYHASFIVAIVLNCINCIAAKDITLYCEFISDDHGTSGLPYGCVLRHITVTDRNSHVVIRGAHRANKTDLDVEWVSILDSNTPFIIRQIFWQFPNINGFNIVSSQLQSINIPSVAQLQTFTSRMNNISHIDRGSFPNQTHLRYLTIYNSSVQAISADAFADLHSVRNLLLHHNNLRYLPASVFASLREVTLLDLSFNELTSIREGVFIVNEKLEHLVLDDNHINELHSNSFSSLRKCPSLIIHLWRNTCANKAYALRGYEDWLNMNTMLQPCIDNYLAAHPYIPTESDPPIFNGGPPLPYPLYVDGQPILKSPPAAIEKSIKIQYSGTLKLYNEAGDLIVEV